VTELSQGVERLRSVPLFAGLESDALQRIAAIATPFDAPPGQVLVQPGAPGSGLFVIEEGTLEVTAPGTRAVEVGPGEFIGELALLTDEGVRTARVQVKTHAHCLAIKRSDFAALLEAEPSITLAMLGVVATRLARTIGASTP